MRSKENQSLSQDSIDILSAFIDQEVEHILIEYISTGLFVNLFTTINMMSID